MPTPFTIAIVGRPNVGKSTLFNRLAGKRLALVDDQPGLTRDRREAETEIGQSAVRLIDTAGFEDDKGGLLPRMREQTEAAIGQADLVVFLIDARAGVIAADEIFADLVRRSGTSTILASAASPTGSCSTSSRSNSPSAWSPLTARPWPSPSRGAVCTGSRTSATPTSRCGT